MPSGSIACTSAVYVASGAGSSMSLYGLPGEMRSAVRSGPISAATALTTSAAKRMRASSEPPQASVRRLVLGARNWWMR